MTTTIDITEPAITREPDPAPAPSIAGREQRAAVNWIWGLLRIALGWIFLWPFFDKLWGLGYATDRDDAWVQGGSPTRGFLEFGTRGPLADSFQSIAGEWWADGLFMFGLLAIGLALTAGVGVRIAAVAGSALLVLMWLAALMPEHNPFIDDHIVYAIALVGLAAANAGDYLGFGRQWATTPLVQTLPFLR